MLSRFNGRYRAVACLLCLGFWPLGQSAYIPAKAWLAQDLMQRAWNHSADEGKPVKPWPWADTHPVARLIAEDGNTDLIVLSGASGRTLAFGPGMMTSGATPGDVGNAVIAGHRDTHFAFLQRVKDGDAMVLEKPDGAQFLYQVVAIDVVDSRRASLTLDTDGAFLSLVTCYPFDAVDAGGPMRYVVTLKRRL